MNCSTEHHVLQYSDVCTLVQNAMYSVIPAVMLLVSIEFKVGKSQLVEHPTYYGYVLGCTKTLATSVFKIPGVPEIHLQSFHKLLVLSG